MDKSSVQNEIQEAIKNNVTDLDFMFCELETLPENIGDLVNLRDLDLSYNELETLPESICKLTNLQVLTLNSNSLQTLPENIGNLINLQELRINNNFKLQTLPKSFGNLNNLTSLYIDISTVPFLMHIIYKLVKLEIIQDEDEIFDYYDIKRLSYVYKRNDKLKRKIKELEKKIESKNLSHQIVFTITKPNKRVKL